MSQKRGQKRSKTRFPQCDPEEPAAADEPSDSEAFADACASIIVDFMHKRRGEKKKADPQKRGAAAAASSSDA